VKRNQELKQLLASELCAIMQGWDQYHFASMLGIHQPDVSALRHGRTAGFSTDRLIRLIAERGYHVEVVLREMPRRSGTPRIEATVSVQRYDRHGRLVERPAPGPVTRVKRWSGEVDLRSVQRTVRAPRYLSEDLDSKLAMDDD
jgi:predicted XRE-type DNA-binding protein